MKVHKADTMPLTGNAKSYPRPKQDGIVSDNSHRKSVRPTAINHQGKSTRSRGR